MNTALMFSSETDLWATPQDFFDSLNDEFNFTLDPCANPQNAKCSKFYTLENDGLKQNWGGAKQCSAIRHTAGQSKIGLRNAMRNRLNQTQRL